MAHSLNLSALATTAILVAGVLPAPVTAQYETPPPPAAWAVTGATVVQADGSRSQGQTLVVRNGLVETLAPGAEVPADARVLEGEGLFVYPGMVDAHGEAELSFPDPRDVEEDANVPAWAPPRSRQGFFPHRRVADALVLDEDGLEDRRKAGVVASLVHPGRGLAPGQPAVLVHRHAEVPWSLVEDASAGVTLTFSGSGGTYPSTLYGVLAYLRQAFLDADRYAAMQAAQARGAAGFLPPGWDPDYEALNRSLDGDAPLWFVADSDEDIRRVLDLSDEFGFRPWIVGGTEAWKLAEELRERDIPVFVSLDFPEPDEWDPETDTVPGDLTPTQAREKEEVEAAWANPARLAEAGVTLVLTSGGGDAGMREGLRTAVEHGLAPEAALAAVTTTPAGLLGLGSVVRIQRNRPATFVVTSGDLFDEDTEVRYTFVEGRMTEGVLPGAEPASTEAPATSLAGGWSGEMSFGGQETDVTITLTQDEEGRLEGTMQTVQGPADLTGRIAGRNVTLTLEADGLPEPIVLTGTVSEDGDTVTGSGTTPFGEVEFEVTRDGGGAAPDGLARFFGRQGGEG